MEDRRRNTLRLRAGDFSAAVALLHPELVPCLQPIRPRRNVGREECVNNREEKDEGRDEVEGIGKGAVGDHGEKRPWSSHRRRSRAGVGTVRRRGGGGALVASVSSSSGGDLRWGFALVAGNDGAFVAGGVAAEGAALVGGGVRERIGRRAAVREPEKQQNENQPDAVHLWCHDAPRQKDQASCQGREGDSRPLPRNEPILLDEPREIVGGMLRLLVHDESIAEAAEREVIAHAGGKRRGRGPSAAARPSRIPASPRPCICR